MSEYPTGTELRYIKNYDLAQKHPFGLIEFIQEIWWNAGTGVVIKGKRVKRVELHTWGWSGNEDIVGALSSNFIFWSLYWQKSYRGGHYYFKVYKLPKGD